MYGSHSHFVVTPRQFPRIFSFLKSLYYNAHINATFKLANGSTQSAQSFGSLIDWQFPLGTNLDTPVTVDIQMNGPASMFAVFKPLADISLPKLSGNERTEAQKIAKGINHMLDLDHRSTSDDVGCLVPPTVFDTKKVKSCSMSEFLLHSLKLSNATHVFPICGGILYANANTSSDYQSMLLMTENHEVEFRSIPGLVFDPDDGIINVVEGGNIMGGGVVNSALQCEEALHNWQAEEWLVDSKDVVNKRLVDFMAPFSELVACNQLPPLVLRGLAANLT
eukprot:TRINITY_DN67067_c5_g1_i2.p1 TRINITY_DN67067_c5_g1~~TRINITY_DN67067_c5_g1_i2.p1  ORF type:complete len:279 (+),score=36.05 TRINITY_DN67067_c5_g1_i2:74-910(+)